MRLAKIFLAVGIAVVFAIFVGYALLLVYERPEFDYKSYNSCYRQYDCSQNFKECQKYDNSDSKYQECYANVRESIEYEECLKDYKRCKKEYTTRTPRYKHARNSFYILVAIGALAIVSGMFLTRLSESIGSGLVGGGVLVVIWALFYTYSYWLTLNNYFKLGALGVILAILVYFGYKRVEKG